MKVKALVSFAGVVTMHMNEVKNIKDKATCDALIKSGYVEPVEVKSNSKTSDTKNSTTQVTKTETKKESKPEEPKKTKVSSKKDDN